MGVEDSLTPGVLWLSCAEGVTRVDVANRTAQLLYPNTVLTADPIVGGPLLLLQRDVDSGRFTSLLWRASIDAPFETVMQLPSNCLLDNRPESYSDVDFISLYGDSIYLVCQKPNRLMRLNPHTRQLTAQLRAPNQAFFSPHFSLDPARAERGAG